MKGHCILSHGLDSGPGATKVSAMAAVAEARGWSSERPDYADIDAGGFAADIGRRLQRLVERCSDAPRPLVLAGSSMGAFISALATLKVRCAGLFLLAPPVHIDGYPRRLSAAVQPTVVIHGWHDELIPAGDVVRWAQRRGDRLIMLDDNHRLEQHVDYVSDEFGRFLDTLA
jgi:predicted alpha/beta-hydrolase family hydrolase